MFPLVADSPSHLTYLYVGPHMQQIVLYKKKNKDS